MRCEQVREALSARLDGEDPGLDPTTLERHLTTCAGCRTWDDEVRLLHRAARVRPAEPVPDLTAAIVGTPAKARVRSPLAERVSTARWALLTVALTQLILAAPALLLGDDPGASVHVARELGSFDVAIATGLVVAAWQPARAWGLLPAVAALTVVTAATAALDVIDGSVATLSEAHHLLDLAGVLLLWQVARAARPGRSPMIRRSRWSSA